MSNPSVHLASRDFTGVYRRLIDLKAWDDSTVVGWLEDDFHHFGMTLVHDGVRITDLRVAEPRHPWSACPGAMKPIQDLKGVPLFGRCSEVGQHVDMRQQCTHLFDLAGLLIAHAFHRRDHHRYHAQVYRLDSVQPQAPRNWLRATLHRDDIQEMEWDVDGRTIQAPPAAAGRSIDHGFREWTETMDEGQAEYAWVMRRAVFVSLGSMIVMDKPYIADDMPMGTVCHNYQPEQRKSSVYLLNSIRRFDAGPEGMLSHVHTKP
ncbi:MAG: DUF2889 domain-containing protein [Rhodocyclaceae bacterium]|jgi:hypothetical protein|nr:DUF2889 domain-containing protein [Rhodocyclaceae bacterium]